MISAIYQKFARGLLSARQLPGFFYRSVFRGSYPNTVRQQLAAVVNNLVLHVHPTRVYSRSLKAQTTFGLGLICLYLFIIEWITGIFLMFYYEPSTGAAYGRILDLNYTIMFGRVMRNLHRWAAEAMVVAVALHMCRVFYTGAYKPPREFNWVLGVMLLVLTLALSFTGYLLPWDQLSFWAVTVGTGIVSYAPVLGPKLRFVLLGGDSVGSDALLRFYTLHVIAIPAIASLGINYHIWRVIKDGGLAHPSEKRVGGGEAATQPTRTDSVVPTFPQVVYAELLVFLVVMIVLMAASLLFNAPLEEEANPLRPNNPSKAPWYFLGLQELVGYSAFWGGVGVPTFLMLYLLGLPYVDRTLNGVGVWFSRDRMVMITVWTLILLGILVTTALGIYFRGPNWNFYWPWENWPGPH
jgi:quinol-cytochrome oxidoreductase complex cytochrome b subunit